MSEGKDKLFTNTMEDETFQNLKKSEIKIAAENETSEERRRRILYQILMFGFSFLAFAWLHVSREAWAMAKSAKKQQPFGTETLGYFDTIFLFCYGGALLISGQFGDRFKLRYMVGFGLVLAGVTVNLVSNTYTSL
jgi:sugar phosphate permease